MSDQERGEILEMVKDLDPDKKQFVLGYAAGIASSKADEQMAEQQKNADDKE